MTDDIHYAGPHYLAYDQLARQWLSADGTRFTPDVWRAGRFDYVAICRRPGTLVVLAPEYGADGITSDTVDWLATVDYVIRQRLLNAHHTAARRGRAAA